MVESWGRMALVQRDEGDRVAGRVARPQQQPGARRPVIHNEDIVIVDRALTNGDPSAAQPLTVVKWIGSTLQRMLLWGAVAIGVLCFARWAYKRLRRELVVMRRRRAEQRKKYEAV